MAFANFGIPQLRQQSVMQNWNQPAYDWSAPIVDYSGGEMPAYAAPPSMSMPPPQSPLEQIGQNPATFGGSAPAPTGPTVGAPPTQVAPPPVNTYGSGDSARKLMETINQIYTPEYTDRDRLRALMDAAPERESPGWGRGLAAIGVGLGTKDPTQALANQEAVMFAPHRRAMADWTAKADPFYKTADLENRSNINERTLAGNVATAQTNADRYEAQAQTAAERNRINEIKAMADKAKAERWTVKVEGPDVYMYPPDPSMGPRRRMGSSSGMSTEDKINLEGAWKVAAQEAAGASAIKRAQIAGAGEYVIGNDVYSHDPDNPSILRKKTIEGSPEGTPYKPGTEPRAGAGGGMLEKGRIEQDKLQDVYESNTDLSKWIVKDGNKFSMRKRPKVKEANMFGFGEVTQKDVDDWDAAKQHVDPTYKPPVNVAAPPPPAAAAPAAPKPAASKFPEVKTTPPKFPTSSMDRFNQFDPTAGFNAPSFSPSASKGLGPQNVPKPPTAKGRITIYKNGKPAGTISDSPAMIDEAMRRGYTVGA